MFNTFIYQPILQALITLAEYTGNLGFSIILITLGIRLALLPLTLPSLKAAQKMRELKPEIDELKKKHKDDKVALQQAQMELFKEHSVNPAAGCLPQIVQLVILIALYRVFIDYLGNGTGDLTTQFLWFDLAQPDSMYILPLLAAGFQFVLSFMIRPATSTTAEKTLASQTEDERDDKEAQDMSAMAETMQQQMMYIMPIMTGVIALQFPSGLALYWIVSTWVSIAQQYAVSGWGGLNNLTQYLPLSTNK